jgi:hypothetical protein
MTCKFGGTSFLLDFSDSVDKVAKCRVGLVDFHLDIEEVVKGGVNISCSSDICFLSTSATDVRNVESCCIMVCEFSLV